MITMNEEESGRKQMMGQSEEN